MVCIVLAIYIYLVIWHLYYCTYYHLFHFCLCRLSFCPPHPLPLFLYY